MNIRTMVRSPFFAFIISPFLAYECFFNFMPRVLNISLVLSSIIFSLSLFLLIVPLFKVLFILKNSIHLLFFNSNRKLAI